MQNNKGEILGLSFLIVVSAVYLTIAFLALAISEYPEQPVVNYGGGYD